VKKQANPVGRLVLVVAISFVLAGGYGCSARHPYFDVVQKDYQVKPGTLAVISGDNNAVSIQLAALLTRELRGRSTFRVVSQEDIAKRVPDYPYTFLETKTEKTSKGRVIDSYTEANRGHVHAIQKNLKTDYLFVVWGEDLRKVLRTSQYGALLGIGRGFYEADINGQLFRYPPGAEVGNTSFTASESAGITTANLSEKDNKFVEQMIQSAAVSIADDFLEVTKAGKPSK
jgi:hypothetical protein